MSNAVLRLRDITFLSGRDLSRSMNNRFSSLLIQVSRFLKHFRWRSSSLLRYLISQGRVSITKYFCICLRSFLRVYEETPPLTGQGGYIAKNLFGVCLALLRCSLCHPLSFTTGTLSSPLYLFQRFSSLPQLQWHRKTHPLPRVRGTRVATIEPLEVPEKLPRPTNLHNTF